MEPRELRLIHRARWAYERARLGDAVLRAWPAPILAGLALALCGSRVEIALAGSLLALAAVLLRWRGGALSRGVGPGFLAGAVPLLLPSLAMTSASACSASCSLWCAWSCVVGGVVAGGVVGWRAARRLEGRGGFLVGSVIVAALTGAMGCLLAGAIGVSGMALGFLAAAPLALLAPQRA